MFLDFFGTFLVKKQWPLPVGWFYCKNILIILVKLQVIASLA